MRDHETDFPRDFDLTAELEVRPGDDPKLDAAIRERGLCYDSPGIEEQLTTPSVYHAWITQPVVDALVGLQFAFEVSNENEIIAVATAHPAQEMRRDHHTDTVLETVRIPIRPRCEHAGAAIRDYIGRPDHPARA